MAQAFAEAGMQIILADIEPVALELAVQTIVDMNVECQPVIMDISDRAAVEQLASEFMDEDKRIDLLCANAGVSGRFIPLDEASYADWDWVLGVNLTGTINTIHAFLPLLKQNASAHITITSSMSGLRVFEPSRGQGIYNTTKYALVGMGEALAIDLAPKNIGVSILCPGFVQSNISFSGRNRPEEFGGAFEPDPEQTLTNAASGATDPLEYGRWVVEAVRENRLFVITHTGERGMVEERYKRLMRAFDLGDEL